MIVGFWFRREENHRYLMGAVNSIIFGSEEDTRKYMVKQDSENLWSIANVVDPEIETADSEELITQFSHEVVHNDLADFVDISIQVRITYNMVGT